MSLLDPSWNKIQFFLFFDRCGYPTWPPDPSLIPHLESRRGQLGLNLDQLGHKWDELDSLDQLNRKKIRKKGGQDWNMNVQGLEVEC